jgi:hypothetical protein
VARGEVKLCDPAKVAREKPLLAEQGSQQRIETNQPRPILCPA